MNVLTPVKKTPRVAKKDQPLYYCVHCGCRTSRPHWSEILNYRCPRCGACTSPAKW